MKIVRALALIFLMAVAGISLTAGFLAPHDYAMQFREHANEQPSRSFPLGADELGRDRLSRLLQASRVSLICATAAATTAILVATAVGLPAGYYGGWIDILATGAIDLFLSLPWLFALLTLRSVLPLNIAPWASVAATFILLAGVGWASGARVIRASVADMTATGHILHARATGCRNLRLLWLHILPNLRPVLSAQFWILVPVFLLADANLGLLGLGMAEPLPSLGGMLAELQNYARIPETPWMLAPAVLLILIVASLHFVVSGRDTWE
jgi:peptide/nickel transport system permease protein